MKKMLVCLLALVTVFATVACRGEEDIPNNSSSQNSSSQNSSEPIVSTEAPKAEDWAQVGVEGTFTASVKGEIALSMVSESEISMKWTDSDEDSLDNVIVWLKGQGYNSFNGVEAQKISEYGGKMVAYTAEKTLNARAAGKKLLAEAYYVSETFTLMDYEFKAGELYLDVYEEESTLPPSSDLPSEWPTAEVRGVIGTDIPAVSSGSGFVFQDDTLGSVKMATVMAYGIAEGAEESYVAALVADGYAMDNAGFYVKTLANGDTLQINVYVALTMHPNTYQAVNALTVSVRLLKNAGSYTSWSQLDLTPFDGASIPEYVGGTSFEIADVGEEEIQQQKASLEQTIQILESMVGYLGEEELAELEKLRELLPLVDDIKAYVVTVYGTNEDEAYAYTEALNAAGFDGGEKDTQSDRITVELGSVENNGSMMISFIRMPLAFYESDDGGDAPEASKAYTLPENIKVKYTDGYDFTAIKIGDDYYVQYEMSGYTDATYYKKNGEGWEVYTKGILDATWTKGDYTVTDREEVENAVFGFLVDYADVEGMTKKEGAEVAGRTADVYEEKLGDEAYGYVVYYFYYKDVETGLILKYNSDAMGDYAYEVTEFDTTVTSFGDIQLP